MAVDLMNRQFWEDTVLYFHQYNRKQLTVDWKPGYFLCFLISGQIWGATTNSVGSWLLSPDGQGPGSSMVILAT